MVTVQFSARRSWAMGLPTILDRPTMTALAPERSPNCSFKSILQPIGVHGISPCSPLARAPTFDG